MRCLKRPTPEEMALALSVPPSSQFYGLGAWVEHIAAPREAMVSELIEEYLGYSQPIIAKLFEFGAIYTSPLIPEIPESMIGKLPQAQIDEMHRRRGIVLTNATMEVRQASPRRQQEDSIIREHGYIRVHLSPKRFPVFYQVNWEQRVIAHGPDYVIIDKPAYLPVAPTVDNILESSLAGAARSIGATEPLLITSRLDQATEGVLVLGKSPDFVQRFNSVVRGSTEQYKKLYRALVAIPPPLGHLHHYVKMKCRRVGTPYFTLVLREESADQPKVYPCELIVRSVESVDLGPAAQERFPGAQNAYEVLIELVTGRTHQIRAQLSAVGSPLLGDDLYGPLSDPIIRSRLEDGDPTLEVIDTDGQRLLVEADGPIGLQACRLEIADGSVFGVEGPVAYESGPPWWR